MNEKPKTIGDFIALLNSGNDLNRRVWLENCQHACHQRIWDKIRALTLTSETVIKLAQLIRDEILKETSHWSHDDPHRKDLDCAHNFLRDFYEKARQAGLDVSLQDIDKPLTTTEMMQAVRNLE